MPKSLLGDYHLETIHMWTSMHWNKDFSAYWSTRVLFQGDNPPIKKAISELDFVCWYVAILCVNRIRRLLRGGTDRKHKVCWNNFIGRSKHGNYDHSKRINTSKTKNFIFAFPCASTESLTCGWSLSCNFSIIAWDLARRKIDYCRFYFFQFWNFFFF